MIRFLLCIAFLIFCVSAEVRYTAENTLGNGNLFSHNHLSSKKNVQFFEIMEEAKEKDPSKFDFKYVQYDFGKMIIEINNVRADSQDRTYWGFLRRESNGLCMMTKGVSSHIVKEDEHLYMKFLSYDDRFPSCQN